MPADGRSAAARSAGLDAVLPDLGRISGVAALPDAELRITASSLCRVSRFLNPTGLSKKLPCSSSAAISSKESAGI